MKFHPKEDVFVSGGENGVIEIWKRNGLLKKKISNAHQSAIYSLDFKPDGSLFASGSTNGDIKFWDMNGKNLRTIESEQTIEMLAFSPDGQYLASAGSVENEPMVKLWDLKGELVHQLKGHADRVISVAFNGDNEEIPLLASGDIGGKIIFWSYEGGRLQTLQDLGAVWGLSFSPDGQFLASASSHLKGKIWKINLQKLQRLSLGELDPLLLEGCNWLKDYLKSNQTVKTEPDKPCQSQAVTQRE